MDQPLPCDGDTDAFFSDLPADQAYAKDKCFGCPVQLQCLAYALENHEKYGIWGGLLPSERKRMQ